MSGQSLDSSGLRRHLAQSGHGVLLREVEKAAAKSGAPFLAADKPLAEALEAVKAATGEDDTFRRLKAERDALRRAIKTGNIWDLSAGR